jgi:lipoprotein signal peptidase
MKKSIPSVDLYLIAFIVIILVIVSDLWLKHTAFNLDLFVKNYGVIMGYFSHVPDNVKTIFLHGVALLVLVLQILLGIYLRFKSGFIIIGWAFFSGGVLSNYLNKVYYSFVIDHFFIGSLPAFNLADVAQLIGLILLVPGLIKELKDRFPKNDRRGHSELHSFHLNLILRLIPVICVLPLSLLAFSLYVFKVMLGETLLMDYLFMASILFFLLFFLVILLLHLTIKRLTGPVYAIFRYLNATINGEVRPLKLRDDDYLKDLELKFTEINRKYNEKN